MKFNPLDGDRAKDAYAKQQSATECALILAAFELGRLDKEQKLKNANPFSKKRDLNRYTAYENGYKKQ